MQNRIAVSTTSPPLQAEAKQLAAQLGLFYIADPQDKAASGYDYLLLVTPEYIGLHKTSDKKIKPFYIDFLSGKMLYRRHQASLRKEALARALGVKPQHNPAIVDATAGLGRDSFILAALGFHVIMLERSPILYILLQDALKRAKMDSHTAPIVSRLQLIHTDAISWLKNLPEEQKPQVIYLDPMFPKRQKSAFVKKEMTILQDLLENDEDSDVLFNMALSCATERVVVKRPRIAANIAECVPNFTNAGKANRFDVYLK